MSVNAPQPPPAPTSQSEAVWPTIFDNAALDLPTWMVADIRERHELGVRKYGVALQTFNGRDPVVDAYQEALDLLVYTQQARLELAALSLSRPLEFEPSELGRRLALDAAFHSALVAARHLGGLIRRVSQEER